jgi:hypothetical protein
VAAPLRGVDKLEGDAESEAAEAADRGRRPPTTNPALILPSMVNLAEHRR